MMDKLILLSIILSVLSVSANAQNYSVASVSDSLKENAHAVIREYTKEFELQAVNKGAERVKKVITILDENGDDFGILRVVYDKNSKVSINQVILYDKNGKKVKKISQSDISDIPAYDGASLYSDHRQKYYKPKFGEYPYTLEYVYETDLSDLISYGSFYPIAGYNLSLGHSTFSFIHPADIQFKKKEINLPGNSVTGKREEKVMEKWEFSNIKAFEYEPYGINLSERVPHIHLMPVKLIFDDYTGTAGSWKEYGAWINKLYSGRDELTESEKAKLTKLIGNTQDTISKIKLLYEYMQEHTRYVGIQLGIGGLQPFPAQTVIETGYGDCKALTNYMHAMLRQFGIISYPALVSSGEYIEPIYKDFPNFQQFDHVILCVPSKKDTIWLECTNQSIPFGFQGDFTDDRDVLLITDEGGILAHTRKYSVDDNLRTCKAEFSIDPNGEASCVKKSHFEGLQYYDIMEIFNLSPDEQKKWVNKNSSLPSQQLKELSINNYKKSMPAATIDESLLSKNYCSFTGNYMLLPLNRINVQSPVRKMMKERQSDFMIQRSMADYDTLMYNIPVTYKIESLPAGKVLKSAFGDYSFSVILKGDKIIYSRKFVINQGRYKASEYKNFYEFCLAVSKADNEKVMLAK